MDQSGVIVGVRVEYGAVDQSGVIVGVWSGEEGADTGRWRHARGPSKASCLSGGDSSWLHSVPSNHSHPAPLTHPHTHL